MANHPLTHPENIRVLECAGCFTTDEFLAIILDAELMESLPEWSEFDQNPET
jgi:hypothetical protein